MKSNMISSIVILFLVLVALNGWMYLQQPAMIFFPYRELNQTPANWGLGYEDVSLTTPDGIRLHGWYIPHPGSRQALLFFHGNGGNISHRGDSVAIFHRLGLNVFIIDYRGYGQSEGVPGEAGLYNDARTAWRYLAEKRGFDAANILVFGRSLGGAVGAKLASEVRPGGLILESTFSSARDFAASVFPILSRLVFQRYRFNTAAHVKRVTCPILVLHSPDDEIIPFHLGQKVYRAANTPKFFINMKGDHNSGFLLSQPGYERKLGEFISTRVFKGTEN